MACECCDNAIQHRVRYLLEHERHAPRGMELSRQSILDEIEEALREYDEEVAALAAEREEFRKLAEQRRAAS